MTLFIMVFLVLVLPTALYVLLREPLANVHFRGQPHERLVALTFDDGPAPPFTNALLDILEQHQVKATFFMIGKHIEAYPDLAQAVYRRHHEVGNHSYSHPVMLGRSPGFLRTEVERTDALLRDLGVTEAIPFRTPFGLQGVLVPYVLYQMKKKVILFSVIPRDWKTQDPDVLTRRVVARTKPGSIILFHDGAHDGQGSRQGTVEAVDKIIPALKQQGYQFVTAGELLGYRAGL